jgi:hypothetical protein
MPQPVDLPTEVARITAAERIQQIADRASLAAQQRQALDEQESRVVSETSIRQPQPKSGEVDNEAKRRNPFVGRRRRKDSSEDTGKKTPPERADDGDEHHFDVTV